ncbi:uncharacterized protein KY384_004712 [Bacidia gigantensis]|uniref:uncharacterized protein n=1 Tax=Bacidia gigantensis TaxID=2732470 RepID=UPI001D03661A|nr:uncharacterized protein KY384_004712 [Bacidia gigantensis]KAG8530212.1 hypothetical protein KY384_004712 [Bacidia gigantensis]
MPGDQRNASQSRRLSQFEISVHVKTIEFSAIWFDSPVDDAKVRRVMRDEFYQNAFTVNDAELRLGRHIAARKSFLAAQDFLTTDKTGVHLLARAFRRLPCLENVNVALLSYTIGAKHITQSLGQMTGCEYQFTGKVTIDILLEALATSEIRIRSLNFVRPDVHILDTDRRRQRKDVDISLPE